MGQPLSMTLRLLLVEQHLQGHSLAQLARTHQLSYATVRALWQRFQARGREGLAPDYSPCGRPGPRPDDPLYRAARYLKFLHRFWGAPLIRLKLEQRYGPAIPSVRTLQRWFKRDGLTLPRKQLPQAEVAWAEAPHAIWQIDAKENLRLPSGEAACYLTIVDEHSGALLEAPVFPHGLHQPGRFERGAPPPRRRL
jgi:transposase